MSSASKSSLFNPPSPIKAGRALETGGQSYRNADLSKCSPSSPIKAGRALALEARSTEVHPIMPMKASGALVPVRSQTRAAQARLNIQPNDAATARFGRALATIVR